MLSPKPDSRPGTCPSCMTIDGWFPRPSHFHSRLVSWSISPSLSWLCEHSLLCVYPEIGLSRVTHANRQDPKGPRKQEESLGRGTNRSHPLHHQVKRYLVPRKPPFPGKWQSPGWVSPWQDLQRENGWEVTVGAGGLSGGVSWDNTCMT